MVELIRRSRLGALRIPVAEGGGGSGSTARELFEVVIRLGDADPNVAHIVRNHFSVTERILRSERTKRNQRWLKAVVDGRSNFATDCWANCRQRLCRRSERSQVLRLQLLETLRERSQ